MNQKEVLQGLKDCFDLPPKEFCEKYGFSKETQQYLECITKAKAEKETMQYLHVNLN